MHRNATDSMSVTLYRNSIDTTYYLNGIPQSVVNHCKYLGIIIQSNLNWNKHVEQKVSKANSMLALIQEISRYLLQKLRNWLTRHWLGHTLNMLAQYGLHGSRVYLQC